MATWNCIQTADGRFSPVRLSPTGDIECFTTDTLTCYQTTRKFECETLPAVSISPYTILCPMYGVLELGQFCTRRLAIESRDDPRMYQCRNDASGSFFLANHVNGQTTLNCLIRNALFGCPFRTTSSPCQSLLQQPSNYVVTCEEFDVAKIAAACLEWPKIPSPTIKSPSTTKMPIVGETTMNPFVSALPNLASTTPVPTLRPNSTGNMTLDTTSSSPPGSSTGTTIGIVCGIVGLFLLIGIVLFVRRRRRNERSTKSLNESPIQDYRYVADVDDDGGSFPVTALDISYLRMYRIDVSEVSRHKKLGAGGFGEVYSGTFMNQQVAIKMLASKRNRDETEVQSFIDEMILMSRLASPYIVNFIGAAWKSPPDFMCVLEFMDDGDLRDHLKKYTHEEYSWSDKIDALIAITSGLVYLHENSIIHRDLKSRNVLLDTTKGVKLSDFGVSRKLTSDTMTVGVGTYWWMSPEVLETSYYTAKADVYSLGMIMHEMDTHRIPFDQVRNSKGQRVADTVIMSMVVNNTVRVEFSANMPSWLAQIATSCIQREPDQRPSSQQVLDSLMNRRNDEIDL